MRRQRTTPFARKAPAPCLNPRAAVLTTPRLVKTLDENYKTRKLHEIQYFGEQSEEIDSTNCCGVPGLETVVPIFFEVLGGKLFPATAFAAIHDDLLVFADVVPAAIDLLFGDTAFEIGLFHTLGADEATVLHFQRIGFTFVRPTDD